VTEEGGDQRVNSMISRAALKLAVALLGTASLALMGWAGWMSNTVIELGNSKAAHEQTHISIDNRLVAGNERMNIIQHDVQTIAENMAALRAEYETIKRQLKREGRWSQSYERPHPKPGAPSRTARDAS